MHLHGRDHLLCRVLLLGNHTLTTFFCMNFALFESSLPFLMKEKTTAIRARSCNFCSFILSASLSKLNRQPSINTQGLRKAISSQATRSKPLLTQNSHHEDSRRFCSDQKSKR
ncbi:hypothetical protein HDV57DRAFT_378501 [Trichoderma longibrachiatum]|uniref:Uncharacterized protein n=1 Tax=Trichoderma longibrachiatum ATCC 18648 TaxID=983965 RepID=A0A2T4C4N6_TRILO|nr:hypothetical protein M440DRAFT_322574 [Trichoderma longibrachiatum ATCC 18648]